MTHRHEQKAKKMHHQFQINTRGAGLYEFTSVVSEWVTGSGLLTLFVRHTSCSLVIQENADPDVCTDLVNFYDRLVPPATDPRMTYLTHTSEGPDDMPAHIKASMLPTHLSIPVISGKIQLGIWQGIYLFEHRDRPHSRMVAAHMTQTA